MAKHDIEILYQDEHLLAINKPPGVSVTADRSGKADLLQLLSAQVHSTEPLRLIHRLDKETSGAMVLAKDRETQSNLSRAFAKRQVQKTYLALVCGFIDAPQGRIKVRLARSRKDPRKMHIDPRRGKEAVTEYQLLADFGIMALLAVRPQTGRTHQIRMHMAHVGLPLAIDPLYGSGKSIKLSDFKKKYRPKGPRDEFEESPLIDRLTLHSYCLELPETETTEARILIARPERKFAAAIKMLAKHGPQSHEAFLQPDLLEILMTGQSLPVL
ncbi:MAG: RluA family pseudouridine synthase [Sedimentisphaerales bacterium]|nr:RluA family pseudouridine synthase [Sedimentisphaerales bacterium]